ncbi:alpha-ketoglutarate dependent xanthine dioxygenase [Mycena metata]|uniref:Alpha-ketoglutarate dependent xanthine dioxygenase n=1 Tax=Mycena metata TaxID=1033252 RepID=A0AAD7P235_9AGAR|nr:alpha-ketoglutarate dependent xanthine dioxygenase [Mycena metata]
MIIALKPLPLPASADASKFTQFGREVFGVDPANLTSEQFGEVREALYRHDVLVFRNAVLTPKQQYALTKAFDPASEKDGHKERTKKSLLGPFIPIPSVPQVQLIGNGTVYDHEGIEEAKLVHRSHKTFHKTIVSPEDEAAGATRFYRWDIAAALYEISPPRVTTLYGLRIPVGARQVCRYDDGTGDELPVPLASTVFVSGKTMFALLPRQLKSLAVRARVKYAPHPWVWMTPAHAKSTGLGMESEGLEVPYDELPAWTEEKRTILPMVWKTPSTGELAFQALYPDGAHLVDLEEVRELLYRMQGPAIAPQFVYPHDWFENDLILFNNGGVMQSVVGALGPEQIRVFHECNLAGSDDPAGPSAEDVRKWA